MPRRIYTARTARARCWAGEPAARYAIVWAWTAKSEEMTSGRGPNWRKIIPMATAVVATTAAESDKLRSKPSRRDPATKFKKIGSRGAPQSQRGEDRPIAIERRRRDVAQGMRVETPKRITGRHNSGGINSGMPARRPRRAPSTRVWWRFAWCTCCSSNNCESAGLMLRREAAADAGRGGRTPRGCGARCQFLGPLFDRSSRLGNS